MKATPPSYGRLCIVCSDDLATCELMCEEYRKSSKGILLRCFFILIINNMLEDKNKRIFFFLIGEPKIQLRFSAAEGAWYALYTV